MQGSRSTNLKVGVFVTLALIIGIAIAFLIGSQRNVFSSKTGFKASWGDVDGLRAGSPIRIAGVNVGAVSSVRLGDDGRIAVGLDLVSDAVALVREDSVASIGSKGMLGDKLVNISVGSGAKLAPGGTIQTEDPSSIASYMRQAGPIMANAEGVTENLMAATAPYADEEFHRNVQRTVANLAELSELAASEGGSVRALLTDDGLADEIRASLSNLRGTTAELRRTARSFRLIADEVRTGNGSAHELIYGQDGARLMANLANTTEEAASMLEQVRTGNGTVHNLLYEDDTGEMVENLTAVTADLRHVSGEIRAGRGTIGGLVTDPSIYEDVKRLVGDLERNEILRALVRYSIRNDEARGPRTVSEDD